MEGLAANSMGGDLKASSAQLATLGKSPQNWKKYIDCRKLKMQSWDDYRRNRMISYFYVCAFKVIPDTDTSISHAQLLVDYAEFTSCHDLNEAVRILGYGQRTLPRYAIIHIASAELELKRDQREEAVSILQKALSLEAEPISAINRALQRLNEGSTDLTEFVFTEHVQDETHSGILTDISNRQCESGVCSVKAVKFDMPTSLSTASRQDPILSFPVGIQTKSESTSSTLSIPSCEPAKVVENMIIGDNSQRSDLSAVLQAQPASHQAPSRKLQLPSSYITNRLTTEISGPVTQLSNGTWPVYSSTPLIVRSADNMETRAESIRDLLVKQQEMQQQGAVKNRIFPNGDHLSMMNSDTTPAKTHVMQLNTFISDNITPGATVGLESKRGSHNGRSDSSGESNSSQFSATLRKYRPLNLGPPRRVKVNPDLKKLRDEEEEETQSLEITSSDREPYPQSDVGQAGIQHASSIHTIIEQTQEQTQSGILRDTSSKRSATSLFTAVKPDMLTPLCTTASAARLRVTSGFPWVAQNKSESTNTFSNPSCELPRVADKMIIGGDSSQRSDISAVLKVQPAARHGPSRKLQLPSSDTTNRLTTELSAPAAQLSNGEHPVYSSTSLRIQLDDHQKVRTESTKEILVKQQQIIQQLLQQQQQQQGEANSRTFSVHDPQSAVASGITPAKSHTQSDHKTMVVNGKPYTVMSLVGRGGSAKVYRVYDQESNTILALKCVNLSCANQVIVEGYKNEIILLKKLQHCGPVIKLYDYEYVEASKKLLVVLEYGETDLCKFISQNEKFLHPINIRYFWLQMVSAVHAMHKEGVIHSDLKPANFILVSGEVKLIDFGIANSLQQDNTSVVKENMVGTPSYMSPEALMSVSPYTNDSKPRYKIGVRSDVWSLGCILYQMVYGHTPFQHVRQKLEAIVNPAHEIPFPDKGDPELMDVLKKCLARNILERATTNELLSHPYLQK